MREYLEEIVKPLLSNPSGMTIQETSDDKGVLMSVSVEKKDMGKIIGKDGATINAIRTLIHVKGSQDAQRVSVKVLEPVI